MRFAPFLAGVAIVCLIRAGAGVASAASDDTRTFAESLHWARAGSPRLDASNANFTVPPGARMVTDADAQRLDRKVNGTATSDVEGFVALRGGDTLYLAYNDSGYVTTDDFAKIDPDSMMDDIRKSTEDANAARKSNGITRLHVDGWVAKPTFSKATESARFAIAGHDDGGRRFVNAVALELGRKGYERFTLVADPGHMAGTSAELDALTHDFHFSTGTRFRDYVSGDKLAGVGIAALVGTAAGVTIAKTVGFGAILLLIKKFVFIIIAGAVALFNRLRGTFTRRRRAVPVMPPSSPFENPPPPLNP